MKNILYGLLLAALTLGCILVLSPNHDQCNAEGCV